MVVHSPISRKNSAIVHPAYGARNCKGAESDAVAATITHHGILEFDVNFVAS